MCWRKIMEWFKPDPVIPVSGSRIALLFGINDYAGNANDLNGCLNDIDDVAEKLTDMYPDFKIKKFKDAEVTKTRFTSELDAQISLLKEGDILLVHYSGHGTQVTDRNNEEADGYDEALYLYDGTLIDDNINTSLQKIPAGATVIIALDSCFSGTATRKLNGNQGRFHKMQKTKRKRRKSFARGGELSNWITFSGCQEYQTSADAFINGRYNGAFTYYWLKTLTAGITYKEWIEHLNRYLPGDVYDQSPTLEGKEELISKQIFT